MLQQMSLECHILTTRQYWYWRTLQRTTNGGVNTCCSNNEWRAGALRGLWVGCNTIEGLWLERMLQDTIDSNYGYMMQQNGNILWYGSYPHSPKFHKNLKKQFTVISILSMSFQWLKFLYLLLDLLFSLKLLKIHIINLH